ncbi:MAG: hypothetical protein IKN04_11275 [Clostridia bacterium]|nr:hypothetical protein [Clostridia bacterium]
MKKKRNYADRKPRMCDPGMCDHCIYVGGGDFVCDKYPDQKGNPMVLVVEDWQPNENNLLCCKKEGLSSGGRHEKANVHM